VPPESGAVRSLTLPVSHPDRAHRAIAAKLATTDGQIQPRRPIIILCCRGGRPPPNPAADGCLQRRFNKCNVSQADGEARHSKPMWQRGSTDLELCQVCQEQLPIGC
jgi:hypothetical protein